MRRKNARPDFIPRRILMTTDTVGGVWTFSLELIRALSLYGVQVALASMGGLVKPDQRRELEGIHNLQLYESEYKLEWMPEPWDDVDKAGSWLLDLQSQVSPDLIHLNNYAHGALPWRAPVVVASHSCVLSWWQAVHGEKAPESWDTYREAVTAGLRAADLVVAPSQTMLSNLQEMYGPFRDAEVITNGRHLPNMKWQTKDELVLTVGRLWDEAKNISLLASIARQIPWPVYVAGDDRHPNGHQANLQGLQCLGSLPIDELVKWYSRAAIYALPARYEPFGLSALEAALADCALVLGDIPSLREVWGRAAIYVPPDDPEALKFAITSLMLDWRRLISLGVRGRTRALELTPMRMAAGYISAYGRVLEAARTRQKEELACAA